MTCSSPEAERFGRGDTIRLPFLILAESTIVDISAGVVAAELAWNGEVRHVFAVGSGLTIENPAPPPAAEQQSHGLVTIPADVTQAMPLGALSFLTMLFVDAAGTRSRCEPIVLEGAFP